VRSNRIKASVPSDTIGEPTPPWEEGLLLLPSGASWQKSTGDRPWECGVWREMVEGSEPHSEE
jgi:hypothetical protein